MQEVLCGECKAVVVAPEGPVMVRHYDDGSHDCVRVDGSSSIWTGRSKTKAEAEVVEGVGESELVKSLPSFQETLAAVSLVRANITARVDQLEVQVSGIIVRDVASLMLRVSEVEAAMGKFDGPLLWDLRGRVEVLEKWASGGDAVSFANLEHRVAAVEQVLKLRSELES